MRSKQSSRSARSKELFGGADGTADADGAVGPGLFPRFDVLEGFLEVEALDGVEDTDLEARAGQVEEVLGRELGGVVQDLVVECGVIPVIGGDYAFGSRHDCLPD